MIIFMPLKLYHHYYMPLTYIFLEGFITKTLQKFEHFVYEFSNGSLKKEILDRVGISESLCYKLETKLRNYQNTLQKVSN